MTLTKQKVQDKIEIIGDFKTIQIRYCNQILEDGNIISSSFERTTVLCGDFDSADANGVRAIADVIWTEDVLNAYETYNLQEQENNN